MTHASWNNERGVTSEPGRDNERLEYLGDAVLELVVGEHLFKRYPQYDEGQLTQMRAALVNTGSLARIAESLGLGESLLLGHGAAKTGARKLPSLLANSFEALIGAIFLDHGFAAAAKVFLDNVGEVSEVADENYKGQLQEFAQEKFGLTPNYRVQLAGGPGHKREYVAEAMVGEHVVAEGRGATKQAAEQAAAKISLAAFPEKVSRKLAERVAERATESARGRRRIAEIAADEEIRRKPSLPEIRTVGLLGMVRSAFGVLLRQDEKPEPEPAQRRKTHRGHRGGKRRSARKKPNR